MLILPAGALYFYFNVFHISVFFSWCSVVEAVGQSLEIWWWHCVLNLDICDQYCWLAPVWCIKVFHDVLQSYWQTPIRHWCYFWLRSYGGAWHYGEHSAPSRLPTQSPNILLTRCAAIILCSDSTEHKYFFSQPARCCAQQARKS